LTRIILLGLFVSLGIIVPALFGTSSAARAEFRICNDTTNLVGAALGYRENNEWVSEGWFQIQGESCATLVEGDLNTRFYYVYAEESDRGGQWRGDIFMCTSEREFRIVGVKDCFTRGQLRTGFFEIDTGGRASWMVRLTETSKSDSVQ